MSTDKTGGPAYPVVGHMYGDKLGGQLNNGMTLLDHFAGLAMQGMLSKTVFFIADDEHKKLAWESYEIAGAMLKARARHPGGE